jgi:hypothetical protein
LEGEQVTFPDSREVVVVAQTGVLRLLVTMQAESFNQVEVLRGVGQMEVEVTLRVVVVVWAVLALPHLVTRLGLGEHLNQFLSQVHRWPTAAVEAVAHIQQAVVPLVLVAVLVLVLV